MKFLVMVIFGLIPILVEQSLHLANIDSVILIYLLLTWFRNLFYRQYVVSFTYT
jgi:hypothetical protein